MALPPTRWILMTAVVSIIYYSILICWYINSWPFDLSLELLIMAHSSPCSYNFNACCLCQHSQAVGRVVNVICVYLSWQAILLGQNVKGSLSALLDIIYPALVQVPNFSTYTSASPGPTVTSHRDTPTGGEGEAHYSEFTPQNSQNMNLGGLWYAELSGDIGF